MDILNLEVVSVIYLIGVLILIFPRFINSNSKFKIFLKNISYWIIIILILFIYIICYMLSLYIIFYITTLHIICLIVHVLYYI